MKNYENALRFKGKPWESLDGKQQKNATTTKDSIWNLRVLLGFCKYFGWKVQRRAGEKGGTRSRGANNNYY